MASGIIHYAPNRKAACGMRSARGGIMGVPTAERFFEEIERGSPPCRRCLAKAEAYRVKYGRTSRDEEAPPSTQRIPRTESGYRFAVVTSLIREHRMTDARASRLVHKWQKLVESRRETGRSPSSTAEHVARFERQHLVSPYGRDPASVRKGDRYDHFGETLVVVSVRGGGREITMAKEVRDPFGKTMLIGHRTWHPRDLEHMRKLAPERDRARSRRRR